MTRRQPAGGASLPAHIPTLLDFLVGTRCGARDGRRSRWPSYRDYLRDYRAHRRALLDRFPSQPIFAEDLHQRVKAAGRRADIDGIARELYRARFEPGPDDDADADGR